MNNYNLYHHDDLDGVASSAIFLEFLKSRGEDYDSIHAVNYGTDVTPDHWMHLKFKKPFVIFDFQYHPDAHWWVDHHGSAFRLIGKEMEQSFENDSQHHWDPKAPSGTGLVAKFLNKEYEFEISDVAKRLIEFVDMDDSATYPTLKGKLDMDNPYKELILLLEDNEIDHKDKEYNEMREYLIRNIAIKSPQEVTQPYRDRLVRIKLHEQKVRDMVMARAIKKDSVVYVDATDMEQVGDKAAALLNFTDVPYVVLAYGKDNVYKVRAFWNNWTDPKPTLHLADVAQKINKTAGGHPGIGAFYVHTKEEAIQSMDALTSYINNHAK